jgi:hypothetical protein
VVRRFLGKCCDPVCGRLVWQEGPMVLGWHRCREFEEKYGYGIVERVGARAHGRRLPGARARGERGQVREERGHLIRRTLDELRTP